MTSLPKNMSTPAAVFLILILLGPLAIGMFGLNASFIPNPNIEVPSIVAALLFCGTLLSLSFLGMRKRQEVLKRILGAHGPVIAIFGVVLFGWGYFMSFHIAVPALITLVDGQSIKRTYLVESVDSHHRRSGCSYYVTFKDVAEKTCLSPSLGHQIGAGREVEFTGEESQLGFLIEDVVAHP